MRNIIFAILSFVLFCSFTSNHKHRSIPVCKSIILGDSIYAKYVFVSHSDEGSITLVLKKNNTYSYTLDNHLESFFSSGNWIIRKGALILNSFIQKDNLPVTIKEKKLISSSEFLEIDWVKNLNSDVVKDAQILINGDTSNTCMPVFKNDCRIKREGLTSILIRLSNNIISKWQNIKSTSSTNIEITVNITFPLSTYIFFNKEKFIILGEKLYVVPQKNVKSKRVTKSSKYFLTKIK
jgi:hypothetical protein